MINHVALEAFAPVFQGLLYAIICLNKEILYYLLSYAVTSKAFERCGLCFAFFL